MTEAVKNEASHEGIDSVRHISLIVEDERPVQTHFRVKFDEPLAKIFNGLNRYYKHHHFTYNHRVIFEDDTPQTLKMKDNDYIYVSFSLYFPIVWSDGESQNTRLTVNYNTPFRKLMELLCTKPLPQYVFRFNSHDVLPTDTPRSLRMQADDWIYALDRKSYEWSSMPNYSYCRDVTFWINDMNGTKIQFQTNDYSKVVDVMRAYASQTGIPASQCRFLHNYRDLIPDDTLESLNLKNGDIIGVVYKTFDGPGFPLDKDVTFTVSDEVGDKQQLCLKNNTTVREVLKVYASIRGTCITDYDLSFNNAYPRYSDTLEQLDVKDGDIVNSICELRLCKLCHHDQMDEPCFHLWVNNLCGTRECFRIQYDTPINKVMQCINAQESRRIGVSGWSKTGHGYVFAGCRLDDNDLSITPRTLEMTDYGTIHCFPFLRGG